MDMELSGGHGGHGGEHGGDGGHGDGEQGACSMNMLFNWDTENVCVIFESWRIDSPLGLVFSCLIIIGLAASYELLRSQARRYEERLVEGAKKRHTGNRRSGDIEHEDETPLLLSEGAILRLSSQQQLTRSLFYMAQVFVGFFLMLIFMTYNGYLMASTVIGSGLGFFYFGDPLTSSSKALRCH